MAIKQPNGSWVPEIDKGIAEAEDLLGVYFQVSRAHRIVARLPPGKTGKEALLEAEDRKAQKGPLYEDYWKQHYIDWVGAMSEAGAGDHYLRCWSPEKDQLTLTIDEFAAFRQLGGNTYSFSHHR